MVSQLIILVVVVKALPNTPQTQSSPRHDSTSAAEDTLLGWHHVGRCDLHLRYFAPRPRRAF